MNLLCCIQEKETEGSSKIIITAFTIVIKYVIIYAIWTTVLELFKDYFEPRISGKSISFQQCSKNWPQYNYLCFWSYFPLISSVYEVISLRNTIFRPIFSPSNMIKSEILDTWHQYTISSSCFHMPGTGRITWIPLWEVHLKQKGHQSTVWLHVAA